MAATGQEFAKKLLDVGLHEVEVDDHGWRVQAFQLVADAWRVHFAGLVDWA